MNKTGVEYLNLIDCSFTLKKLLPQKYYIDSEVSIRKRYLRVGLVGSLGFFIYYIVPLFIAAFNGVLMSPDRITFQSRGLSLYDLKTTWYSCVKGLNSYYLEDITHLLFSVIVLIIGANLVLFALIRFPRIIKTLVESGHFELSKESLEEIMGEARKYAQNRCVKLVFLIVSIIIPGVLFYHTLDPKFEIWWGHYSYGSAGIFFSLAIACMLYYSCISIYFLIIGFYVISFLFKHPIKLLPFHPDGCNGLRRFGDYLMLILFISIIIVGAILIIFTRGYLGIEQNPFTWIGAVFGVMIIPLILIMPLCRCVQRIKEARSKEFNTYEKCFQASLHELDVSIKDGNPQKTIYKKIQDLRDAQKIIKEIYGSNIYPFNLKIAGGFVILNLLQIILLIFESIKKL